MVKVIEIKFKTSGRVYYFDPLDLPIKAGDGVIVETARGMEFGEAANEPKEVEESEIVAPLKPVVRIATDEDRRLRAMYAAKESEAYEICLEKIAAHGLDMKLVDVEYTFNGSKVVFYFTADERVDFRELVKDLAYALKTRIELRQIGVRDEAKMLGGLGPCGRLICCKSFLDDFRPVSIKMAKEQNLSLSPTKISGLCGRLMCCLQYEQSAYEAIRSVMPKPGKEVNTVDGVGVVVENNAITERTKVRLTMEDGSIDIREYPYTHLGQPGEPLPEEALAAKKGEAAKEKDADAQFRKEAANNTRRGSRNAPRKPEQKNEQANPAQKPEQKPAQKPEQKPAKPAQNAQQKPQQKQQQKPAQPKPQQQKPQNQPKQNAQPAPEESGDGQKKQFRRRPRRRPNNAPKAPDKNS
ncbi:MAG: stage 0 sporulation family protein [Clostridia bacterium]|nr:stage 0 sporulation family protein [Clostridia bacterium]